SKYAGSPPSLHTTTTGRSGQRYLTPLRRIFGPGADVISGTFASWFVPKDPCVPLVLRLCHPGWAQYPVLAFAEHAHGEIIPCSIRDQSILAARLHQLPPDEGVPDQARRSLRLRQRA